ncbi:hypothetical protein HanRHA438_Chr15g0735201 [Helianthus annuus]|nr:hypothetical protein HanRHA438_Chr15g0735201 [Helianthus annuus]
MIYRSSRIKRSHNQKSFQSQTPPKNKNPFRLRFNLKHHLRIKTKKSFQL